MLNTLVSLFIIILYFVKPSWIMPIWLITEPIILPIVVFFMGITDAEESELIIWTMFYNFNRAFLFILVYEIIKKRFHPTGNFRYLLSSLLALSVYFVIHNILTHFDLAIIKEHIFSAIYSITPLAVFIKKESWPKLKYLLYVAISVIIVQVVWLQLNQNGIFAYIFLYGELAKGVEDVWFMSGTFMRANALADYISLIYLYITIDFFYRRELSSWLFVLISVLVGYILLTSGSKLPLIVTIVNLLICIFFFTKRKTVVLIPVIVLFCLTTFSSSVINAVDKDSGMFRIVSGLNSFTKSKSAKSSDTTFDISANLIDQYYWESPIIGCGYSYKGPDRAYPLRFNSVFDLTLLRADATFAYYLTEFGIVGIVLYFLFFSKIIRFVTPHKIRKHNIIFFILFIFYTLFSITEGGFFNPPCLMYMYVYIYALRRHFEENLLSCKMELCNVK